MADEDRRQDYIRRVSHPFAVAYLFVEKPVVILPDGMLEGVMLGIIRLDQDTPLQIAAARTSGDLGYQLKGPFRRTEIREPKSRVDGYHTDKRHIVKVVPFREHLRADKHVGLAAVE